MKKNNSVEKQSFMKKHFNAVAMTAIVLIPTIYTTLFLGSMWDPYGKTDQLPVAVVNEDVPVEYGGTTLDIGRELTERLSENKQLDFHFENKKDAEKGLENGDYYMMINIPSDFSENASTLMDNEPKKMQLDYKTNPGTNYIASKMSESALTKIEKEVSASVTKEYAETIFDQLGAVGKGMDDAAEGASEIKDGAAALSEGNTSITDNLKLLSESTLTFKDGAKTFEEGISTYTQGVSKVNVGAHSLSNGMDQLAEGADSLSEGAAALSDGTGTLYSGVNNYTKGVSAAYSGASTLSGNNDKLKSGANSLIEGASSLQQGSSSMTAGLQALSDSLSKSLSKENTAQIEELKTGLTGIQNGLNELDTALRNTQLPDNKDITDKLSAVGASLRDASAHLSSMQSAIASMTATDAFQSLDSSQQQELLGSLSAPMQQLSSDISNISAQYTSLSESLQGSDSSDTLNSLKTSVSALSEGADIAVSGAKQTIDKLSGGLENVKQTVDNKLLPGSRNLSAGLASLTNGSSTLKSGLSDYTVGVSDLTQGLKTLDENSSSLVDGASALKNGAESMKTSLPSLTEAVSQLKQGAAQLSEGTAELNENSGKLNSGAAQLSEGAEKIQNGASQLAGGSAQLGDGLSALTEGSEELHSALSEGAEEINSLNTTDLTLEMISSPVESHESFASEVATNGNAMAAYMMAVGLWVAGLAFCVMLSPHERRISGKNALSEWASQLGKLWCMAVIQAVIMVFSLILFNGFEPEYAERTLLIACLSSIAFLTLEYCVNFFMGIIGSFVLLVLMVFQLSGCAGTYPLELSGRFYQILNPFMPFTYTVHGFRSGIASGQDITTDCIVLAAIALVSASLLLLGFRLRLKNQQENESENKSSVKKAIPAHI